MPGGARPPPGVGMARFRAGDGTGSCPVRPLRRERVRCQRANLFEAIEVSRMGAYDVVFCRNVLIYAHDETIPRFLEALQRLVRPGGYLFLGPSESLLAQGGQFRLERVGPAFTYVRVA